MILDFKAPFCIVGAGKTGQSVYELLLSLGHAPGTISFFDDKTSPGENKIRLFSSPEELQKEFQPRTLFVSPGYPLSSTWIQEFEANGGLVSSELELVSSLFQKENILAVTGSLGKSTITSMLGEALLALDSHAFVGGNLGIPLASYMKQVLSGQRARAQFVALELSSYQLERCRNFKCQGAIVSYLSPNHLDRYLNLEQYYETKWKLVEHCHGPVVLNYNSPDLRDFVKNKNGNWIWAHSRSGVLGVEDFSRCKVIGEHQRDNLSLVAALLKAMPLPFQKMWHRVELFPGLEHRLEYVGEFSGVKFINDSKATAMESVLSAVHSCLEAVRPGTKLFLLLGGKDKNLPWSHLQVLLKEPRVKLLAFGACRDTVEKGLGATLEKYQSLKNALAALKSEVRVGDWILLSPGGTSLDEFKNFEDRGTQFKNWVREIYGERNG